MKLLSLLTGRKPKEIEEKRTGSTFRWEGGWNPLIREPWAGAWQRNQECSKETVLTQFAVFSCMTLIASDIGKLRLRLMREEDSGVWREAKNSAFNPVLRKPNHFQTRGQFWEHWMLSKLATGNTYALKQRDARGVVTSLYILDPTRVQVRVTDDGDIWYELNTDWLSDIREDSVLVPARDIIHDRYNTLFHPLIGVSPIRAAWLSASQSINIQRDSEMFFGNRAMPGGILTAPGAIADETANRLRDQWETSYSGANVGKVAVLGDGLKFEAMRVNATDAQVVEQLRWTAEVVCAVFHVPPYKIGVQPPPSYNNVQALNVEYYSQALQKLIEDAEAVVDEGLGLGVSPNAGLAVSFDLDGLFRMDTDTQMKTIKEGVGAGVVSPNEGRARLNLPPVRGGETPYLQQQNYSLEALDERDRNDPFAPPEPPASPEPEPQQIVEEDQTELALSFLETRAPESLHVA